MTDQGNQRSTDRAIVAQGGHMAAKKAAAKKTPQDYMREMREKFAARGMKVRGVVYTTEETARGLKCLAALSGQPVVEYLVTLTAEAVEAKLKQHGIKPR